MLVYSTFVTGLQEPIAKWVADEGHRVRQVFDGAILYDKRQDKKALPCFFNSFTVFSIEKKTGKNPVEQLMRKILQKPSLLAKGRDKGRAGRYGNSFRIVTSQENNLISVDKRLRNDAESLISARTGLIPERRGGGREFWFLSRSEGFALFMERQAPERRAAEKERKLKKGELRPQLAYCLNRLAMPSTHDIMVDPFCGYGAITRARKIHFPCRRIYGLDIDGEKIKALPSDINYKRADIAQLSSIFKAQSVDVIITDPPWGIYKNDDIVKIYTALAEACNDALKPGGRAVVLSAQKELMRTQLSEGLWGNVYLKACYDILVSGQKAAIFVISASAN